MPLITFDAKTQYAFAIMRDLATHHPRRQTLPAIAERNNLPVKFLPQVLSHLGQAGLVNTIRGYGGGVELAKEPTAINMLDILMALGSVRPNDLTDDYPDALIAGTLRRANIRAQNTFANVTLHEIAQQPLQSE